VFTTVLTIVYLHPLHYFTPIHDFPVYRFESPDLIERAQFALNPKIYKKGEFKELYKLDFDGSWLEWFLFEIECFHGQFFSCHSGSEMIADDIER
jgi:hypothetical protein